MNLVSLHTSRMRFYEWLGREADMRRKGRECKIFRGSKEPCRRCGYCCHTAPGALAVEDITRIAKFLKVTRGELISKYLTLHDQARDHVKRPCPIRKGQEDEAGRYLSISGSWKTGACVFYEEKDGVGSCRIHPVKPYQCRIEPKGGETCWPPEISEDHLEMLGFSLSERDCNYEE